MGCIELMPGEVPLFLSESIVNTPASFGGDMGILATQDQKQLRRNLATTGERVVILTLAERSRMNIGREPAGGRRDPRV